MAVSGGSALLCVSGAAVGAALTALFSRRDAPKPDMPALIASLQEEKKSMERELEKKANELMSGITGKPSTRENWQGFTMAEARQHNDKMKSKFLELTPLEVLQNLQRGNARFWTGTANRPEVNAFQRRALIMQQFPSTAILGCSDSRVPTELIFDQPLGELFVVRVAGNALGLAPKASLQYAINHLKVKVLLVLGHEGCGAVKAAELPVEKIDDFSEDLAIALKSMKEGLDEKRLGSAHDGRARDREAVVSNVKNQVRQLYQDRQIMKKVQAGELLVIGCFYEISSGIVDFFNYLPKDLQNDDVASMLTQERPVTSSRLS